MCSVEFHAGEIFFELEGIYESLNEWLDKFENAPQNLEELEDIHVTTECLELFSYKLESYVGRVIDFFKIDEFSGASSVLTSSVLEFQD